MKCLPSSSERTLWSCHRPSDAIQLVAVHDESFPQINQKMIHSTQRPLAEYTIKKAKTDRFTASEERDNRRRVTSGIVAKHDRQPGREHKHAGHPQ
jgi:hypothetical protein